MGRAQPVLKPFPLILRASPCFKSTVCLVEKVVCDGISTHEPSKDKVCSGGQFPEKPFCVLLVEIGFPYVTCMLTIPHAPDGFRQVLVSDINGPDGGVVKGDFASVMNHREAVAMKGLFNLTLTFLTGVAFDDELEGYRGRHGTNGGEGLLHPGQLQDVV